MHPTTARPPRRLAVADGLPGDTQQRVLPWDASQCLGAAGAGQLGAGEVGTALPHPPALLLPGRASRQAG